MTIFSSTL